ncbi:uncharacterized protein PFLUO_LOCUS3021 [Penicillium psychrofluorescens]|uniref:uncharacterized protein n=1 Tax=Penicillium psychrofluorescens TaxID=3158075 RepID=UPI003CCE36BE
MRVAQNHTGIENRKYKLYQVKEALLDIQVWMLCAQSFLQCIPGGGLTAFGKIVLQGLGYSNRETIVMGMPADGIQLIVNVLAGVISQVIPNTRCLMMILSNIIVLIGSVLIQTLPVSQRLAPNYILYVNTIPFIMCLSLISSNIGGFTKKATCGVMMFIAYAVGQIVAPQFFIDSQAPTYPTGFRAFYVSVALMIVIEVLMVLYLVRQNRKKARTAPSESQAPAGVSSADFQDLTDREHPHFRYVY